MIRREDPFEALETLIELGVERVLTSGAARSAVDGVETLAKLVERAGERIIIMAGGSLNLLNLETVMRRTGVAEVHLGSAVSQSVASAMKLMPLDGADTAWTCTEAQRVAAVVELVQSIRG